MGKGGIIGKRNSPPSGIWDLTEQYNEAYAGLWSVVDTSISVRYVRWNVSSPRTPGNIVQASEFVLQLEGADISMVGTTVTASIAGFSGEGPGNLVDSSTATKYAGNSTVGPWVLTFDLGSVKEFDAYRWATANDVSGRDPDDWIVETSPDNSTWTTRSTVANAAVTTTRFAYVGPYPLTI